MCGCSAVSDGDVVEIPSIGLAQAGLKIGDIDLYEVNEAFASVPVAWAKELKADLNKVCARVPLPVFLCAVPLSWLRFSSWLRLCVVFESVLGSASHLSRESPLVACSFIRCSLLVCMCSSTCWAAPWRWATRWARRAPSS